MARRPAARGVARADGVADDAVRRGRESRLLELVQDLPRAPGRGSPPSPGGPGRAAPRIRRIPPATALGGVDSVPEGALGPGDHEVAHQARGRTVPIHQVIDTLIRAATLRLLVGRGRLVDGSLSNRRIGGRDDGCALGLPLSAPEEEACALAEPRLDVVLGR